jgi:hypothetical protein
LELDDRCVCSLMLSVLPSSQPSIYIFLFIQNCFFYFIYFLSTFNCWMKNTRDGRTHNAGEDPTGHIMQERIQFPFASFSFLIKKLINIILNSTPWLTSCYNSFGIITYKFNTIRDAYILTQVIFEFKLWKITGLFNETY